MKIDTTQYCITSSGDSHWHEINANTLRGAKAVASRTYQQAVGGKIMVGERIGQDEYLRYETIAVKYGYGNWQDAR